MKLLLKNGIIYTIADRVIERGYILCENGMVSDVGDMADCPPCECEAIDLYGAYVLPGLIDAHTHAGLFAEAVTFSESLCDTSCPVLPRVSAADFVRTEERAFSDALLSGVTTAVVSPDSTIPVSGRISAFKTYGRADERLIASCVGMKFSLGENPRLRDSAMDIDAVIREALVRERDAFLPVLSGNVPAVFHCHRASDILTAIRIAEDFSMRYILLHATEAAICGAALYKKRPDIITGPVLTTRSKPELSDFSESLFAELSAVGLSAAICTDFPELPAGSLMLCAAVSASHGADELDALRAITATPARLFGLDGHVGAILPGLDADLVIYNNHPFDLRSHISYIFARGERII